jgi:hypothetical protein
LRGLVSEEEENDFVDRLAAHIFQVSNVAVLTPEHILHAFSGEDQKEAASAFHMFDVDNKTGVTKPQMIEAIKEISKENKNIKRTMKESKWMVDALDHIFSFFLAVFIIIIGIIMFEPGHLTYLVSVGSYLVGLSFIFGKSAGDAFQSIMFVFLSHPYDTGKKKSS